MMSSLPKNGMLVIRTLQWPHGKSYISIRVDCDEVPTEISDLGDQVAAAINL